ncbi:MAG: helix-turn-helix transcriptional regulator [Candidatus Marinimicrobia bacterium]|jgi:DNA-binding transcriptional ArsR family regulator|nr:helix-turn-helix transcriptional regulator [Bacteroidota bacterium]MBT3937369.1 helix-turn-helix transcriptional regulator [Candidatus Neomarinimicrobiota bacterium]MBT3960982.1 helix-turn-helix transcriptional regulator [Candidatus Neomarinimicrobiota bacterium]MBT4635651.1 helix-turn-helix transcriptional regulator [Candidatus Neomarinimicrobiota bacterium]MBT5363047.1 helix-turn-helix transcriptional regulator [Candidatus Neomarinimicrobiota bacterium]
MAEKINRSCKRSYINHDKILKLQQNLVSKDYNQMGELLSVFGNPTRIKILDCLAQTDELCVCDIADILAMDISTISHQLKNLKMKGYLKKRRDGLTIYYRLSIQQNSKEALNFIYTINNFNILIK